MISEAFPQLKIALYSDDQLATYGLKRYCREELSHTELVSLNSESALLNVMAQPVVPDVLMLELVVGGRLTFHLIERLRKHFVDVRILVIARQSESAFAERCIRSGANGFLNYRSQLDQLATALSAVSEGEVYLSQKIQNHLLTKNSGQQTNFDKLTRRELDVFHLLGLGKTTKEIARVLDLSVKTIESYRDKIKEKLMLRSSFELVRQSMEYSVFDFEVKHERPTQ